MIESSSNNGVAAGKGKPTPMARGTVAAGALALAFVAAAPAQAADGCTVLLCLAAPRWRAIAQCVPPVREVLRDLARGGPVPVCAMAGAGNEGGQPGPRASPVPLPDAGCARTRGCRTARCAAPRR
jgi:hypothetical protein